MNPLLTYLRSPAIKAGVIADKANMDRGQMYRILSGKENMPPARVFAISKALCKLLGTVDINGKLMSYVAPFISLREYDGSNTTLCCTNNELREALGK